MMYPAEVYGVFMPGGLHPPLGLMPKKVKPSSSGDQHGDRLARWFAALDRRVCERWAEDSLGSSL